jgi:hypothetical protein
MASPEMAEFLAQIDALIEATRDGTMVWQRANPSTFVWRSRPTKETEVSAILNLQKVEHREVVSGRPLTHRTVQAAYIFQAIDRRTKAAYLTMNGIEEPALNERLGLLFETISAGITRKGLEFLKKVIPQPKPKE